MKEVCLGHLSLSPLVVNLLDCTIRIFQCILEEYKRGHKTKRTKIKVYPMHCTIRDHLVQFFMHVHDNEPICH